MGKSKSGFSYLPDDAVDGGGTEGALATIAEIGFVEGFTYGGRQKDKPQVALHVVYNIEGFKEPWDQNYSIGPDEKYELVEDGDGCRSAGTQTGINRKCAAFPFFEALKAAIDESGEDLDDVLPEIDGEGVRSVRPLEGRRVKLTNVKFTNVSGDTKDLVVIGSLVGDDEPKKGNKASTGKSKKSSSGDDDVEVQTEQNVVALLDAAKGHTIKKANLPNLVHEENRKDPNVKAMMALCFKDAWVFSDDRPWDSDRKKGTIAVRE